MKNPHAVRTFLLSSTLLVAASTLHAADGTWNVDANGTWGTAGNWTPGIADGSGSTANFTNNITADRTVSLDGDRTLTRVVFGDSDTATAGSWVLNNNGTGTNNLILAGTTPGIAVNALGTGKTATISAIIEGTAGLVKSGNSTLTLSGVNTYTGNLTVDGGTLIGTATNNAGSGAFGSFASTRTINVNSGGILDYGASNMGGGHTATNTNLVITGGTVTNRNTGNFNSLNNVTLNGGTLTSTSGISTGDQWGAWHINGTVTSTGTSLIDGASTNGRHIRLNANANHTNFDVQSGTLTVSAPIRNGKQAASPYTERTSTLTKLGTGVMILSGANTYTGTTTVSDGTLGGTGTINGSVTVAAAGNIAPGASVGTLSIGGGLNLSAMANGGSGKLKFELGPIASSDKIAVTGALTIGIGVLGFSDFVFTDLGGLQATGGTPYKLITTTTGVSGSLDLGNLSGLLPGGLTGTLQVSGNDLQLLVASGTGTPEIAVEQPAGTDIANGGSRDFGTSAVGGAPANFNFTIRNTGPTDLYLTGTPKVAVSGTNASDFTVTSLPASPVTTDTTTPFTVRFAPSGSGARNAVLNISSDDSDEGAFTINLSGTAQEPYEAWSAGATFAGDANNDGVTNGMAWMLGAANKNADATGLLPKVNQDASGLVMTFDCLSVANRGTKVLTLQHSGDLGGDDSWDELLVPDTAPFIGNVSGVDFVTTANGDLIHVVATIPSFVNAMAGKLFGRLKAGDTPPEPLPANAGNPLFTHIYTADPAPHGNFGDGKLYLYVDHDTDYGSYQDMFDYRALSTTNLIDWTDHGSILNVTDFKWTRGSYAAAWDGDCQKGPDGKYYYYAPIYPLNKIGVAVSDSPTGPFVDALGYPLISKQTPGVKQPGYLVTANVFFYQGDPYMLFGQDIFYVVKLKRNMIELADNAVTQLVKPEQPYFWEGPWIDYHNGVFTMTCVVKNQVTGSPVAGTIDYATSTNPYGPYVYKGVVMQRKGLNEQMGIAHFKNKHYFFYHIDGPRGGIQRYTCVEEFNYLPYGDMPRIEQTKKGVGGPPTIKHDAFGRFKGDDYTGSSPGIRQNSSSEDGPRVMYVEGMKNNSWVSFENFDFGAGAASFEIEVDSAGNGGLIELRIDSPDGQIIGSTAVSNTGGETGWRKQTGPIMNASGAHDLYMVFNGEEALNLKVRHFWFKR